MLNLNPGQYDALEAVATRWQNEDQSISETLSFSDYQARKSFVYGKAKEYAKEYARKADAAHGQMENLESSFQRRSTNRNRLKNDSPQVRRRPIFFPVCFLPRRRRTRLAASGKESAAIPLQKNWPPI